VIQSDDAVRRVARQDPRFATLDPDARGNQVTALEPYQPAVAAFVGDPDSGQILQRYVVPAEHKRRLATDEPNRTRPPRSPES
jgi:hypothetical protein